MLPFFRQQLGKLGLIIVLITNTNSAQAQIVPDSTLGAETTKLTPNVNVNDLPAILIEGGATRGVNLFHSFLQFNVAEGQRVYFANPTGIENILTRVTGNDASKIYGTLGVDGIANVFLLNPNGIIFGANGRLDVAGSFLATTANSFVFENGLKFSATNPETAPLLTVNLRPGLQFAADQSGIISNHGNLSVGQDLTLVGGNLDLQGKLQASRNLTLQAQDTISQNGDIISETGGDITIAATKVTIENSLVNNSNFGDGNDVSNIIVKSLGDLLITNSNLETVTYSSGKGGDINIAANSVSLVNKSSLFANTLGTGKAGSITVNANNGAVSLADSSINTGSNKILVDLETLSNQEGGGGGDINITAAALFLTNNSILNASTLGSGDSGSVSIRAEKTVSFTDNSILNARTYLRGNAGNINIITQSFSLGKTSRIDAQTFGSGNAGNVNIKTQYLSLTEGSRINAETFASGNGGNITINPLPDQDQAAAAVNISGSAPLIIFYSGLSVNTESQKPNAGSGGNITINTGSLNISDGGVLNASSKSSGSGGNININVNNLQLAGGGQIITNAYRSGSAGSIKVSATDNIILAGKNYAYEQQLNQLKQRIEVIKAIYNLFLVENDKKNGLIFNPINSLINNLNALLADPSSAQLLNELKNRLDQFTNSYDFLLVAKNPEISSLLEPIKNLINNFNGIDQIIVLLSDPTYIQKLNELKHQLDLLQNTYNFVLPENDSEVKRILGPINQYSGLFANTEVNSTGNGGTINIDPIQVTIKDEAKISVDSQGTGVAGDISITSDRLSLDNHAKITADTNSGAGGRITLNLQDLLLFRRQSVISTTAGKEGAGGDGGAIAINLNPNQGFIVSAALENNDIAANAFSGSGGIIEISAKGVIGLATLTREELEAKLGTTNPQKLDPQFLDTNDITAISQTDPQLNGIVSISSPDIDPSKGIVSLPTNASDPSQQIAQSCGAVDEKIASAFTDTGRGGLPPKPDEFVSSNPVWQDVRLTATNTQQAVSSHPTNPTPSKQKAVLIMPATGWVFNNKGEVTLISQTPQSSATWFNSSSCAAKSQ
ncbi:filamentous hemagglutinin-like protein [Calothrix sp. NIES-2100]|uniref:two-partner secretion domain-containing protein n=1 Tax=Calothrix sp. NIES-2100 TaxID=1954172 RepID=UPI000B622295|nr:filamentous hemagglutinin-like protein [Calothrix sp. NIES-2100]